MTGSLSVHPLPPSQSSLTKALGRSGGASAPTPPHGPEARRPDGPTGREREGHRGSGGAGLRRQTEDGLRQYGHVTDRGVVTNAASNVTLPRRDACRRARDDMAVTRRTSPPPEGGRRRPGDSMPT